MPLAATIGRVLSKVAITPPKPARESFSTISAVPRMLSAGMRALSKTIMAVSDARRTGRNDERLDGRASLVLVERRPHDDEAVRLVERAVARGAEDLGAVEHPLVAVAHGRGRDLLRVAAEVGLGDRHRGPLRAAVVERSEVALLLLGRPDGLDGRAAEARVRDRQ